MFQELDMSHRIHWRNFAYGEDELHMLCSRMRNVYFGCSPQVLQNKTMNMNIRKVPINRILPESAAPHISVHEVITDSNY